MTFKFRFSCEYRGHTEVVVWGQSHTVFDFSESVQLPPSMSHENVSGVKGDDDKVENLEYTRTLSILQKLTLSSPKVLPQVSPSSTSSSSPTFGSKYGTRRNKFYATIVNSNEDLRLSEDCIAIHIRTLDDGSVDLAQCRRHLFSAWSEHALLMIGFYGKQNDPLKIFELKTLGLTLICCPDPRPDGVCRVTLELAEDHNFAASRLLMADSGWDSTQIGDIFGPILVMSRNGDDMNLRRLRGLLKSIFGADSCDLSATITLPRRTNRVESK